MMHVVFRIHADIFHTITYTLFIIYKLIVKQETAEVDMKYNLVELLYTPCWSILKNRSVKINNNITKQNTMTLTYHFFQVCHIQNM